MLPRPTLRRRIALTGLYNSGKTVFLTSLLDQLHNDADEFLLGKNRDMRVTEFSPVAVANGWQEFPYESCRKNIVENHVFPDKTRVPSRFHFNLQRSDDRWRDYLVQILDFPGERFADASMVGRKYPEWSDTILAEWDNAKGGYLEEYRSVCEAVEVTAEQILIDFKRFLAKRLLACQPHICPSTFKLGLDGKTLSGRDIDALLQCGTTSGVAPGREFAPLPPSGRSRLPLIAGEFARNYDEYRQAHVEPLFAQIGWCDRLIVLIDVPFLLEAGAAATNDNHELLESILKAAAPSANFWVKLAKGFGNLHPWADWRWGGIQKIAFVAAKSDLVARSDRDNLVRLVREMVRRCKRHLRGVEVEYFACSAVVSTRQMPPEDCNGVARLSGRLKFDRSENPAVKLPPSAEPQSFEVSRVPASWPQQPEPGTFRFEEVYPDVPRVKFASPKHSDLDKVFDFVVT